MNRRPWSRRWKGAVRTLHVLTSTFALLLTFAFGASGFLLHHADWFGLDERTVEERSEAFPPRLLEADADRLAVVDFLRARCGVAGLLDSFEAEADGFRIRFVRPGEETEAVLDRHSATVSLRVERRSLLAALGDLHRGEGSGFLGGLLLDATSLSLLVLSATGLALWLTLPRRRRSGLVALALGVGLVAVALLACWP